MRRLLVLLLLLFIFISCTSVPNMGYLQPNGDYYENRNTHFTLCLKVDPYRDLELNREKFDKLFEDDPVEIYEVTSAGNAFMSGEKVRYHGVLAADIVAYNKGFNYLAFTNWYPNPNTTTSTYTSYNTGNIYSNNGKVVGSFSVPTQNTYNITRWSYQSLCIMYNKEETLEKIKKGFGEVSNFYMDYDPKKK